jgi:hypothetical protein
MERKGQKIREGLLPNRNFLILQRFTPSRKPWVNKHGRNTEFPLNSQSLAMTQYAIRAYFFFVNLPSGLVRCG